MPFDCNLEIFADAFCCNLWYSFISFKSSLFSTLGVPLESIRKSFSRSGGEIVFVWSSVCCVYIVSGRTQIFFSHNVERRYSSVRLLHSTWQLKCLSCMSWFNSKSK